MTNSTLVEETLQTKPLFGGAIAIEIPASFSDVSDRIPVPDHQEVFTDDGGDISLIVEINESSEVGNNECGAFYFQNLADVNEATNCKLGTVDIIGSTDVPGVTPWHYGCIAEGEQEVSKGRRGPECAHDVHMVMAVIRLPDFATDILIILNNPIKHPGANEFLRKLLATFRIDDYSLFGS